MSEETQNQESDSVLGSSSTIYAPLEEENRWRFKELPQKRLDNLYSIIVSSMQEILSSYIEPLMKQWIRNFHNILLICIGFLKKFSFRNLLPVPRIIGGKNLSEAQRENLAKGGETELITGFTSKNGKNYSAYLRLESNGQLLFRFPEKSEKKIDNQKNEHLPVELLGIKLNDEIRQCLMEGNETPLIKGFKSKKGNLFNAYLKTDSNGNLKFRFPEREPGNSIISDGSKRTSTLDFKEPEIEVGKTSENMESEKSPIDFQKSSGIPLKAENNPGIEIEAESSQKSLNSFKDYKESDSAVRMEVKKSFEKGFPNLLWDKELDQETVQKLQSGSETPLIKGFRSPSGKTFDAYLSLLPNSRIQVRIPSREKDLKISVVPKIILGITLSDQHKVALKLGEETSLIKGFCFGKGKPFDGFLKIGEKGSLILRTPMITREMSFNI